MKYFLSLLLFNSMLLFSKENYDYLENNPTFILGGDSQTYVESMERNATLIMDGDGQDYLFVFGEWYRIDICERVYPIRYGD
jgi:hypothetical protein